MAKMVSKYHHNWSTAYFHSKIFPWEVIAIIKTLVAIEQKKKSQVMQGFIRYQALMAAQKTRKRHQIHAGVMEIRRSLAFSKNTTTLWSRNFTRKLPCTTGSFIQTKLRVAVSYFIKDILSFRKRYEKFFVIGQGRSKISCLKLEIRY